jgi:uncharacterized protein (UPF0332 family)
VSKLSNSDRLIVSKSDKRTLRNFRTGVHLSNIAGATIDDLAAIACKDRFGYARQVLGCARWALNNPRPQYRVALARSYYAMYHAARAVTFFIEGGDDHQEHSVLPGHIPGDFPNRAHWENELKNARLERNKADYDPYPKSDQAFAPSARSTLQSAENFLPVAKHYLLQKGCNL